MLAIVARSASDRSHPAPGRRTRRTCRPRPFFRSASVTVRTRSVAVAPSGSLPRCSRKPITSGISMAIGWPEHRRLRLDAAHAPAEHAEAVDHGGVAVGAEQRVGIGVRRAVEFCGPHRLGEVLEVDLVADAGARGVRRGKLSNAVWPQRKKCVALAVALELERRRCALQRVRRCRDVDHDRVVDHQVDRHQRVDLGRAGRRGGWMPSRMAARSTTAGTPVKSCIRMRAGRNGTSSALEVASFQPVGDGFGHRPPW